MDLACRRSKKQNIQHIYHLDKYSHLQLSITDSILGHSLSVSQAQSNSPYSFAKYQFCLQLKEWQPLACMDFVRIFPYLHAQGGSLSQGRGKALPPPSQTHLPPSSHDPVCWVEWDPWRPHTKGSLQSHRCSIVTVEQGARGIRLRGL